MNRADGLADGDRVKLVNDTDDSGEYLSDSYIQQQHRQDHVPPPRENGNVNIRQSTDELVLNSSRVANGREIETNTYTELLRGSVPCPTCRGNGSIPKEQEGQLVALIPLKDKRLKPRRTSNHALMSYCHEYWEREGIEPIKSMGHFTLSMDIPKDVKKVIQQDRKKTLSSAFKATNEYLYVCLAVFLCLTAAGLLLFFMFPRNVTIESNKPFLLPQNLSIAVQSVQFLISNPINITNQNYFSVTVNSLMMTVLFRTKVIATTQNKNTTTVPIRDTVSSRVDAQINFNALNEFGYMAILCNDTNTWFHEFVMVFDFTVNYSYLGHTEMATLTTYQTVSCGNDTAPTISTLKPHPLTTTEVTTTELTTSGVDI